MQSAPPDSVGVVDTMGCALPQAVAYLVREVKRLTNGLPVEVHTHNDFGLAVAGELAGIAAGADVVHTCVNGLGERTGNAALEEMILCMNILLEMDTPYRLDRLGELCALVEKLSGVAAAPNKPFVGARNYMRESGIGVDPALFGRSGEIALGKKSGKASIQYYLERCGMTATDEQAAEMLARVKARGLEKRGLLDEAEFREIAAACLGA